jgi:predicted nucleotidyltransferase
MQTRFSKQEAIEEITRRLVEFYRPIRIYLFGSGARGDAGPDSDLDFLVVVPDDVSPEKLNAASVYSFVSGTGHAKDIIPWRKTDFEARAAPVAASLPAAVVREGKVLYDTR